MEPARAGGGESLGHRQRVGAVGGLPAALAAPEPDHFASEQIHRRDRLDGGGRRRRHHAGRRKLESTRAPSRPLFSGWNWIPVTRPVATTEAKRPP